MDVTGFTSLAGLLSYDRTKRCLSPQSRREGATRIPTLGDLQELLRINELFCSCIDEELLATEVLEIVRQRLIALLIPEEALFGKGTEVKPLIRKHLISLGVSEDEELISAIKVAVSNYRQRDGGKRKYSINDVRVRHRMVFQRICNQQNDRCATCGKALSYGSNMELDHIFPNHIGNDPPDGSNWQFLCGPCNRGKNEWMHYSARLGRLSTIHSQLGDELSEPLRYACLERDRSCTVCGITPQNGELLVSKKCETGCWILDNCATVCVPCNARC